MIDLTIILSDLIFIFLQGIAFFLAYYIFNRKTLQPAVVFSFVWFTIILLRFFFRLTILDELYPINVTTYLVFFAGTSIFIISSYITQIIYQNKLKWEANVPIINFIDQIPQLNFRIILTALILAGLPLFILASYRVFLASNIDNFFVGLRTELSYGEEDIGPLKYLVSFSFVIYSINLFSYLNEKNKKNLILLLISLTAVITYAIFSTGRTFFLMILAIYLGISYIQGKRISLKRNILLFGLFLVFFTSMGIFYGKGGDTNDTIKDNLYPASQITATYLTSSLNALDYELNNNFHINYDGQNTLRFFKKLFDAFNTEPSQAQDGKLIKEFVFVPYPTNVYTFYSPYIKDFGILYALVMLSIFSVIHTLLFCKALHSKNIRFVIYYAFMLYPLMMSFFQDQYISLFSTWLQIIFYTELILFFNKLLYRIKW